MPLISHPKTATVYYAFLNKSTDAPWLRLGIGEYLRLLWLGQIGSPLEPNGLVEIDVMDGSNPTQRIRIIYLSETSSQSDIEKWLTRNDIKWKQADA